MGIDQAKLMGRINLRDRKIANHICRHIVCEEDVEEVITMVIGIHHRGGFIARIYMMPTLVGIMKKKEPMVDGLEWETHPVYILRRQMKLDHKADLGGKVSFLVLLEIVIQGVTGS